MFEETPAPTRGPIPTFCTPRVISQEALRAFSLQAVGINPYPIIIDNQDSTTTPSEEIHFQADIQHLCAPFIHPTTGEIITSYKKLANDPALKHTWQTGFGKDWGSLAQGDKRTGAKGTNTFIVLTPSQVPHIPEDRTVTYANIVVDYRPQKKDPNLVRITAGGNLIFIQANSQPGQQTSPRRRYCGIVTNARYICLDIKNFYLCAPMERYEYMKMSIGIFPRHVIE